MFSSSARHCCVREPPAFAKVLLHVPDASYVFNISATGRTCMHAGVPLDEYSSLELLIMHSADWRGGSSLFHR